MPSSFKDLRVWREAIKFTVAVYRVTGRFPKHELYGLTQQLRRAVVSVPSNIAEGTGHRSDHCAGTGLHNATRRGRFVGVVRRDRSELEQLDKLDC